MHLDSYVLIFILFHVAQLRVKVNRCESGPDLLIRVT